jgi:hypothetical protein
LPTAGASFAIEGNREEKFLSLEPKALFPGAIEVKAQKQTQEIKKNFFIIKSFSFNTDEHKSSVIIITLVILDKDKSVVLKDFIKYTNGCLILKVRKENFLNPLFSNS